MAASMMPNIPAQTLRQLYDATRDAREVQRDISTSSGLVNYELQRPAKQITPLYFPLGDMVPRVTGIGGTQTNWKVVTALNTANFEGFVGEGNRAAAVTTATTSKVANYVTLYQEDNVTFEEEGAAAGFEDIRATTAMRLMWAVLNDYEFSLYGGNTSLALTRPTAPTLVDVGSGGGIATGTTVVVAVVALTPGGLRQSSIAGGVAQPTVYTAPDGSSYTEGYGASQASLTTSITTGSNSDSITATTPLVTGAVAYAWFWGATNVTAHLGAITTVNSNVIKVAVGTGAQVNTAPAADHSANPLAFDGFLTQAIQAGTLGSNFIQMATGTPGTGTGLTASGAGTITEIDNLLQALWDSQRMSPDRLVLNSQELRNIYAKIMANGGSPLVRFTLDAGQSGDNDIMAGRVIGSYLNQFTVDGGRVIKLLLHPNAPKGTILAFADRVPIQLFPGNNLGQLYEYHMPPYGDIRQIEWPLRTRKYETGVQMRGVLAHYFPASMGVITNIGNA